MSSVTMENIFKDEFSDRILAQLYDRLELLGFVKGDWVIERGDLVWDGHSCTACHVGCYWGLDIVNKSNPTDRFKGGFDFVHVRNTSDVGNIGEHPEPFVYWEYIKGEKKMAEKYKVATFTLIGIPQWILDKFGAIYK